LENSAGRFYVGSTDNLYRRLSEHNASDKVGMKFTHKNGPWHLVWAESHPTRASAVVGERFIKSRKFAVWIRRFLLGRGSPDVHQD